MARFRPSAWASDEQMARPSRSKVLPSTKPCGRGGCVVPPLWPPPPGPIATAPPPRTHPRTIPIPCSSRQHRGTWTNGRSSGACRTTLTSSRCMMCTRRMRRSISSPSTVAAGSSLLPSGTRINRELPSTGRGSRNPRRPESPTRCCAPSRACTSTTSSTGTSSRRTSCWSMTTNPTSRSSWPILAWPSTSASPPPLPPRPPPLLPRESATSTRAIPTESPRRQRRS
mmetsp:Transcript_28431/g.80031  ORF Transcript_28431/g.80031 Transcript_28431/m.80031 type:complete len:227 (-) Transcript_28431:1212-1892(-)